VITRVLSPVLHGVAGFIFPPHGRHRRPVLLPDAPFAPVEVRGSVLPEDELLDGWPVPLPVVGAVVATCFDDCVPCGKATAGVLTKDGWRCGECQTSVPAGGVGRG
jgi:hypothetical protein